jgi:hypothetical protein
MAAAASEPLLGSLDSALPIGKKNPGSSAGVGVHCMRLPRPPSGRDCDVGVIVTSAPFWWGVQGADVQGNALLLLRDADIDVTLLLLRDSLRTMPAERTSFRGV